MGTYKQALRLGFGDDSNAGAGEDFFENAIDNTYEKGGYVELYWIR